MGRRRTAERKALRHRRRAGGCRELAHVWLDVGNPHRAVAPTGQARPRDSPTRPPAKA